MKKRPEEPEGENSGWAIPYGDFLTLMLCVFIALYAVSRVDVSKYKVLAESLTRAFHGTTAVVQPVTPTASPKAMPPSPDPSPIPTHPVSLIPVPVPLQDLPVPGHEGASPIPAQGQDIHVVSISLQKISAKIAKALEPWVKSGKVTIHQTTMWLEIEIRTDVLFKSGVAKLSPQANKVLQGVAGVLSGFDNQVRIEGYTDNRPIDTSRFPSNWELSSSRAASVAELFAANGVKPGRLGIVGWSKYRPFASNATTSGRAKNRRIVIVVLSDRFLKQLAKLQGSTEPKGQKVTAILEPLPVAEEVPVTSASAAPTADLSTGVATTPTGAPPAGSAATPATPVQHAGNATTPATTSPPGSAAQAAAVPHEGSATTATTASPAGGTVAPAVAPPAGSAVPPASAAHAEPVAGGAPAIEGGSTK